MARLLALGRDVVAGLRGHDLVLYAAGLTFLRGCWASRRVTRLGTELARYLPENLGPQGALATLYEVGPRLRWHRCWPP